MRRLTVMFAAALVVGVVLVSGCTKAPSVPSFSLAWSEYPSWSVFGVADAKGLIDGAQGKLGPIEEKWGVDIELKEADYDPCLQMYGSNACDAVCMTNMDSLSPSLSRNSVAILPTSTSHGADALIVDGDIADVQALRNHKVYGLEASVSEYCFARNLELQGEKEEDHQFTMMDPGAAATAMQTKSAEHKAIVVWNPFVMQTLKTRQDTKVLFDSKTIPEEIIDMVVMSKDSLAKDGGEDFACAVIDTYYQVSKMIDEAATRKDTLMELSKKFADLTFEEMEVIVDQTRFYGTPDKGLTLFEGDKLKTTMQAVSAFCVKHEIVKESPKLGYGADAADSQLRFDPTWMKKVRDAK